MWGKKPAQAGGIDFDTAAARVTAEAMDPTEATREVFGHDSIKNEPDGNPNAPEESSERLEVRPEWAVAIARTPYAVVAKLYHPAFALSDEQAEALGPKVLPLIRKVTDVWIPSWLAGVSNRNPELTDAVFALALTGYVQWMNVQKIQQAERDAAADNAKRVQGERVTEMPLRSEPGVDETRIAGQRLADGSLVI